MIRLGNGWVKRNIKKREKARRAFENTHAFHDDLMRISRANSLLQIKKIGVLDVVVLIVRHLDSCLLSVILLLK